MLGDCLDRMKEIPDGSVDLVLCDPPYGTTRCKWDAVIPLEPMWEQLHRIAKASAAIVMTCSQPFTSALIMSNAKHFKYSMVWEKTSATGFLNAKRQPLRAHEDVVVFYRQQPTYNPQFTDGHKRKTSTRKSGRSTQCYGAQGESSYDSTRRYPRSVQKFAKDTQKQSLHPTQKPLGLMAYLIRTYTNPGDIVLDFTMGSGTTGVACKQEGRSFIGIEMDETYFEIAKKRIEDA
jgi:DNA modification methylase